MSVLIAGAGGQLGLDLLDAFADHSIVALTRADLDIGDGSAVLDAVQSHVPALVINAGAWTDVDGCESNPERAHRVNALGPWWLARACETVKATLVHVSTDYVFDGDAPINPSGTPRGWTEFDRMDPINTYGRTKAAGEHLIRQTLPAHHVVRTAWVNGARGSNFVRTMLRLADDGRPIRVVDDQTGSPTFTHDLAAAIRELADTNLYGTVNRTNTGHTTWYGLARAIFDLADLDVDLSRQSSAEMKRPAPRPRWSVLDDTHATTIGLTRLRPWQDALHDLLIELGRVNDASRR